jgi:hypothetical protein
MKELTEEKRFALAASLLFRQLARAYDDAADMDVRFRSGSHGSALVVLGTDKYQILGS